MAIIQKYSETSIRKNLKKKESCFSQFGTGSHESLSKDGLIDALKNFFHKYYSSNLMKLVVYGNQKISTLEKWVVKYFSSVKN